MPIGSSKLGVLGAGLVPGGSVTFNSSGNWTVPPGVKKVSITGKGGTGNPGVAGNPGNSGNPGSGGSGGGGGSTTLFIPGCGRFIRQGGPGGASFSPDILTLTGVPPAGNIIGFSSGPPGTNIPPAIPTCVLPYSPGNFPAPFAPYTNMFTVAGRGGRARCFPSAPNPQIFQPGNFPLNDKIAGGSGFTGKSGNAGQAGQAGNPGNSGQPSSALGNTFPGGAGGSAGVAGNAGNGGSGGGGGGGGSHGGPCTTSVPSWPTNPRPGGSGGSAGGGAGGAGTANGANAEPPLRGAYGGGGAGTTNSGENGPGSANPTPSNEFARGGNDSQNSAPWPNGSCWNNRTLPTPPGAAPANMIGGAGGSGATPGTNCCSVMRGWQAIIHKPLAQFPTAPEPSGNNRCQFPQFNPSTNRNNIWRAGAGGGGTSGVSRCNPIQAAGGGGGGGGRGNAGNAGAASPTPSGQAANPVTFNCVPVTPGTPTPITVGSPGGQIVISWNPQ